MPSTPQKQSSWQHPSDDVISSLLRDARNIAVVGCSPRPVRSSYKIAAILIEHGYHVMPVHPIARTILDQPVYPDLHDIPVPVDIVNVFRRAEFAPAIAEAAVAIGAKALWLQQGIISEEAYRIATDHGLICVMDQCIAVTHRLLLR
ncbi:MAG: CoA-binding protein [Zetaproteobacteria bacterium CG_4_9_14_3_um_filter_49_83]|nr:MAG: CoA-binding protein [Zetaproteobacteria bacterium CG1_02_49_23]PIQ34095.1 MAG: CoA-binding protein [Zetaproteobacteria bacterium CG17_big_fil_post_rev_8_21_14_2_50_50_13]PIV30228.1 MAG: CoA-binding protein [Zetaproteobacteria bacterium CG02_land_8_20_14_3_00_50_9]PIY55857.1 MAG: CoA-binding protein [Zetaproteobacteria bacterium CG_4_10_14_0_8_um_filter_49_80]PJA34987.1 MAG: CoA-binding protein [Zetaproteobacteria bacterium CG_4_9_14_3_um_filter_49_83]